MAKGIDTIVTRVAKRRTTAKRTAKARPTIGTENLQLLAGIAHDVAPQVRASSGLATALRALYGAKLEDAEAHAERLGKGTREDAEAYRSQLVYTQELRGMAAMIDALAGALATAARKADRMEEITRRFQRAAR